MLARCPAASRPSRSATPSRGPAPQRRAAPTRAASGDQPAAAPKRWPEGVAPPGVPLPPLLPTKKAPLFGFVDNAEVINSRAAMIGFFSLLALEAVRTAACPALPAVGVGGGEPPPALCSFHLCGRGSRASPPQPRRSGRRACEQRG